MKKRHPDQHESNRKRPTGRWLNDCPISVLPCALIRSEVYEVLFHLQILVDARNLDFSGSNRVIVEHLGFSRSQLVIFPRSLLVIDCEGACSNPPLSPDGGRHCGFGEATSIPGHGASAAKSPARAQQVTGVPGSPTATEFPLKVAANARYFAPLS